MCGIAGIVGCQPLDAPERERLTAMLGALLHRGPDHSGMSQPDPKVLLGHDRLAIIDLDPRANQPMQRGPLCITYNGEIYNYRELRAEMRAQGVEFRTESDTEVVLAAYETWGEADFLERLDGMFAFALFDGRSGGKLLLARDRLGKKPLYYSESYGRITFASEVRAFREAGDWSKPEFDREAVMQLVEYRFSSRLSPFTSVSELAPGHCLSFELASGRREDKEYFSLSGLVDEAEWTRLDAAAEADLIDELDGLLGSAVEKRLIADVPVSSINSGGIDSSLISAMAARHGALEMFHMDVENDSERVFAERVAARLRLPLTVCSFSDADFLAGFRRTVQAFEFPLIHANNVAVMLLAQRIHESGYKVVLGGEVADELFGGYPHQIRLLSVQRDPRLMASVRFLHRLASGRAGVTARKVLIKTRHPVLSQKSVSNFTALDWVHVREYEELLGRYAFVADQTEREFAALCLFDLGHYVRPLLMRGDKLFMASSVEQRLPFADPQVMRFAMNLPSRYRLDKQLLRQVARRYLPAAVIDRPKNGFRVGSPAVAQMARNKGLCRDEVLTVSSLQILAQEYAAPGSDKA